MKKFFTFITVALMAMCAQAQEKVEAWIKSKPDCPEQLVNQVKQAMYTLRRRALR